MSETNFPYSVDEIKAAYKAIDYKPQSCLWIEEDEGVCCPMTALYLEKNGLDCTSEIKLSEEDETFDETAGMIAAGIGLTSAEINSFTRGFDGRCSSCELSEPAFEAGVATRKALLGVDLDTYQGDTTCLLREGDNVTIKLDEECSVCFNIEDLRNALSQLLEKSK